MQAAEARADAVCACKDESCGNKAYQELGEKELKASEDGLKNGQASSAGDLKAREAADKRADECLAKLTK